MSNNDQSVVLEFATQEAEKIYESAEVQALLVDVGQILSSDIYFQADNAVAWVLDKIEERGIDKGYTDEQWSQIHQNLDDMIGTGLI